MVNKPIENEDRIVDPKRIEKFDSDGPVAWSEEERARLRNEDPLSGEAGSHPLGAGVGAALGAAATGAMVGSMAGPVGSLAGTIIGGLAGAIAGKALAEEFNPTYELEYWKGEYTKRDYYNPEYPFEHYHDAYRAGWEASAVHHDWEAAEEEARQKYESLNNWENEGGAVRMSWDQAKAAAKDAFERVKQQRQAR